MRWGLQKLTLLDFPGQVACTVFSAACNFRCPFCHNASLVTGGGELPCTTEDLLNFLRRRSGVLDGVCITGGEPLMNCQVPDLISQIKQLGFKVKLDTNGSFPDVLEQLLQRADVDFVAMDIKSSPAGYARVCGASDMIEKVQKSVELLKSSGTAFEFRTTVTGNLHRVEDFTDIGQWIGPVERYFLQRYVNSGDVLDRSGAAGYAVTDEFMQQCLAEVQKFVPNAAIRGL